MKKNRMNDYFKSNDITIQQYNNVLVSFSGSIHIAKWYAPKLDHWIFSAVINTIVNNIDIGMIAQTIQFWIVVYCV